MGRKQLKAEVETVETKVRMPKDLHDRINKVAGPNRMAAFIRAAVESELARREGLREKGGE